MNFTGWLFYHFWHLRCTNRDRCFHIYLHLPWNFLIAKLTFFTVDLLQFVLHGTRLSNITMSSLLFKFYTAFSDWRYPVLRCTRNPGDDDRSESSFVIAQTSWCLLHGSGAVGSGQSLWGFLWWAVKLYVVQRARSFSRRSDFMCLRERLGNKKCKIHLKSAKRLAECDQPQQSTVQILFHFTQRCN